MKIYITHLLQILNFSSSFRQPTMGADNISNLKQNKSLNSVGEDVPNCDREH